jgi:hypothetical protein
MNTFAEKPDQTNVDLLEKMGHSREDALRLSMHEEVVVATASVGAVYSLNAEELSQVWKRAARAGARTILLDVRAQADAPEEYTGQIRATVIEHDPWPSLDGFRSAASLIEKTRSSTVTPAQRRFALERITARRAELLQELADLTDMATGHEEALAESRPDL